MAAEASGQEAKVETGAGTGSEEVDLFDAIVTLEESISESARAGGVARGRELGLLEGRELGLIKGAEIGSEVGFYEGCVVCLIQASKQHEGLLPARAQKPLLRLREMLAAFPVADPLNERLFEDLQRIRAKFKVVTSLMKLRLAFDPKAAEASRRMAF